LQPPERHAAGLGGLPSFFHPGQDQGPLKFGDPTEDGQDHLAERAGLVGPRLIKELKSGMFFDQDFGDPQQLDGGSRQTIELGDPTTSFVGS